MNETNRDNIIDLMNLNTKLQRVLARCFEILGDEELNKNYSLPHQNKGQFAALARDVIELVPEDRELQQAFTRWENAPWTKP